MNRYILSPNSRDKSLAKRLKNYFLMPIVYLPNLTVFEAGLDELELILLAESFKRHPYPQHRMLSSGHGICSPYCPLKNVSFFITLDDIP
jgi:hypothetical protein